MSVSDERRAETFVDELAIAAIDRLPDDWQVDADSVGGDRVWRPDLTLIDPSGQRYLVEVKAARGPVHFSSIAQLDHFVRVSEDAGNLTPILVSGPEISERLETLAQELGVVTVPIDPRSAASTADRLLKAVGAPQKEFSSESQSPTSVGEGFVVAGWVVGAALVAACLVTLFFVAPLPATIVAGPTSAVVAIGLLLMSFRATRVLLIVTIVGLVAVSLLVTVLAALGIIPR